MATRGDDASTARHRAADKPRPLRRGTLTPEAFEKAVWWTRYTLAAGDVVQGAGFIARLPTNSATYHAMEFLAPMWAWGVVLVVVGFCIPIGRIQAPAFLGMLVWACFMLFNTLSLFPDGAWALGFFLIPVSLHLGMFWFITRDSIQQRAPRKRPSNHPQAR